MGHAALIGVKIKSLEIEYESMAKTGVWQHELKKGMEQRAFVSKEVE